MQGAAITLDELNALDEPGFVRALDGVFEHAPWIAAETARLRPFASVSGLHDKLMQALRQKSQAVQIVFLNAHPALGSKEAKTGAVTADSAREQGGLGVLSIVGDTARMLDTLNARYQETFGFPFIICARRHTQSSVLAALQHRLEKSRDEEVAAALAEIAFITRLRLVDRVTGPQTPRVAGRLSTHVLDMHGGRPAQGVQVEVFEHGRPQALAQTTTNAEGRTDQPLIGGVPLRIGIYELVFHMGNYYRDHAVLEEGISFLDQVYVRFGINEPEGHYHVPLVATPWSYSTYRGS